MEKQIRRDAIITLFLQGKRNCEIVQQLRITEKSVRRTISRYRELGKAEDRPRSGRPRTANIPANRNKIKCKLNRNRRRSKRKMAQELGISAERVRHIVNVELGQHSYKLQEVHELDDRKKGIRLQRCRQLRRRVANGLHRNILFSDETPVDIEEAFNKQNDRIIASSREEANAAGRLVGRVQFPRKLMIWGGISYEGKTPLIFFNPGERINSKTYCQKILRPLRDRWGPALFGDNNWTYQQDSAGPHASKETQDWCHANFTDFIEKDDWPSNSPDLSPLDYCIWGILKAKACATRHTNLKNLKKSLRREWNKIDLDVVRKCIDDFPKRLLACINAEGGHIENV